MTLIDLFRLLWAKPVAVWLSIHRTQGHDICGFAAIQPLVDLCCQRWLGLTESAAQARRFLPNSAPWRSLPHLPPKRASAPVDLSALIYRQCTDRSQGWGLLDNSLVFVAFAVFSLIGTFMGIALNKRGVATLRTIMGGTLGMGKLRATSV